MNKEELFQILLSKISSGEITQEEVTRRLNLSQKTEVFGEKTSTNSKHFSITKILYLLGAAIVVIGIIIFVGQIWEDIGSFGHISVTLGLGILFTAIGSFLLKSKPDDKIGPVFTSIGGLLVPGGAMVTLFEINQNFDAWAVAIIFGVIAFCYFVLNMLQKNVVLTLFTLANGTAFIYSLVFAMLDGSYMTGDVYAYLTMVIGMSYVLLGYSFREGFNEKLSSSLYFLGSLGFLGSAFSRVFDSGMWQLLFFILVVGGLYLSVQVKNRGILVVSTLFLVAHVSFITSKYFADSLGWPISLIMLGFIFIGLGYMSININKKYISN